MKTVVVTGPPRADLAAVDKLAAHGVGSPGAKVLASWQADVDSAVATS